MEKKKYNLRSAKTESLQMPIQVQLSDDNDFMTNLLGNSSFTQQSSDSSSDSELDCSVVVDGSDSDDVSTQCVPLTAYSQKLQALLPQFQMRL